METDIRAIARSAARWSKFQLAGMWMSRSIDGSVISRPMTSPRDASGRKAALRYRSKALLFSSILGHGGPYLRALNR